MTIERTVNYKMCRACKGKFCCQEHSGIYAPSDFPFELTVSNIKRLLNEKKASISSCIFADEPDKIYLYLSVPEVGKGPIDLFTLPTPCSYWNPETGCKFKRVDKRPWSCATLEPSSDGCIQHYSPDKVLKDWMPYQKKLEKVILKLTGKTPKEIVKQDAEVAYISLRNLSALCKILPEKYYTYQLYLRALGYTI